MLISENSFLGNLSIGNERASWGYFLLIYNNIKLTRQPIKSPTPSSFALGFKVFKSELQ